MANENYDYLRDIPYVSSQQLEITAMGANCAKMANEIFVNSLRQLIATVNEYSDDDERLFQVSHLYRRVFTYNSFHQKDSQRMIHEVVRQLMTGEANKNGRDLNFIDALRFVKTISNMKRPLSSQLYDVVEGKGDDSYGDFLDSFILVGKDVWEKTLSGCYKKGDWELLKSDIIASVGEAMANFIIEGENYIEMYTTEKIQLFFNHWVKRQSIKKEW